MFWSLRHLISWIVSALGSRKDLILENLALRQQLLALHAQRRHWHSSLRLLLRWPGNHQQRQSQRSLGDSRSPQARSRQQLHLRPNLDAMLRGSVNGKIANFRQPHRRSRGAATCTTLTTPKRVPRKPGAYTSTPPLTVPTRSSLWRQRARERSQTTWKISKRFLLMEVDYRAAGFGRSNSGTGGSQFPLYIEGLR